MDQMETYLLLLSDSFFTNLAIDTSTELVIHALKIFGNYQPTLVIAIATMGFLCAAAVNYLFGKMIFKIVAPSDKEQHMAMVARMNHIRNSKLLPIIIILSAIPFWGKFVILFAGFCSIRFRYTICIVAAAKLSYYTYLIFLA